MAFFNSIHRHLSVVNSNSKINLHLVDLIIYIEIIYYL